MNNGLRWCLLILCILVILFLGLFPKWVCGSNPPNTGWQQLNKEQLAVIQQYLAKYGVYCEPFRGTSKDDRIIIDATSICGDRDRIVIEKIPAGIKIERWPLEEEEK